MFNSEFSILEIVEKFPETEEVFRSYDEIAGKCVLCHNLFDTLMDFCSLYDLDLDVLISDLESCLKSEE